MPPTQQQKKKRVVLPSAAAGTRTWAQRIGPYVSKAEDYGRRLWNGAKATAMSEPGAVDTGLVTGAATALRRAADRIVNH